MEELGKEAQEWLAKHAVLLGPEELPFEEEKIQDTFRAKDGEWPIPYKVPYMGIFAEISDEESFNRIVGDQTNWAAILGRSDMYQAWIVPQAVSIFGRPWFNRRQWGMRQWSHSIFGENTQENGNPIANTTIGRSVIFRIVARVEHALDRYLSGGGCAGKATKKPGGYIVRSIANEFVREICSDMGYRLARTKMCPNCLATKRGRARRCEAKHIRDGLYSCERCSEDARNLSLVVERHKAEGIPISAKISDNFGRALRFSEFSGIVCVCPNNECRGHFVPVNFVENEKWWSTPDGIRASKALSHVRILKDARSFRAPSDDLMMLPLCCPFCGEHFTPASALRAKAGFQGCSGKFTGLPSAFIWTKVIGRDASVDGEEITQIKGAMVDDSNIDPSQAITAWQRVGFLVGELAIHAQSSNMLTAPSIISRCFYEGVADWMMEHPCDASRYFFDWTVSEGSKKTTHVMKGSETAIHHAILRAWIKRISGRIVEIRNARGSKMKSLEDLKWFCHPPTYAGGPKVSFTGVLDQGLRIQINNNTLSIGKTKDKPRMAWIMSIKKIESNNIFGPELLLQMRACDWRSVTMSPKSGLIAGDMIKIVALLMPGHHCHAPIQRIIRLRTSLLSAMIERIRLEEGGQSSDKVFWQEWHRQADVAKKATGIGIRQGA